MKQVLYILVALALWLLFSGNLSISSLVIGLIVSVITVLSFHRYLVWDVAKLFQPIRYYWFAIYLFIFAWECLKANLDVAYRVLHPDLPIKPGIVKVKTRLKTDIARTTLANSITMTPGTITVDIVDDFIYVHWIYVSSTDPIQYTEKISGRFEKYIQRIFE
ncbi:MAG: Na+/H+ antiporter subunit E [Marinilabiliaceae bacterium]|nr:Na+/H+ antiporter subunit E [Marinilabiliaceae bacterium]